MRHPDRVWSDLSHASEPLDRLRGYWIDYLRSRSNPASEATIRTYSETLVNFTRNLETHGEPLVLASLTPQNLNRWVADQRQRGLAPEGIASRLAALKSFSNKYLYRHLEITTLDLLEKVPRVNPPARPFERLTKEEQERIIDCFDKPTFADTRNKALVACYLATGRRFQEILNLDLKEDVNLLSGEIVVRVKGGDTQISFLSPRALKILKRYLRIRPEVTSARLWLTVEGEPLSRWGARSVFRRLKIRSGVEKIHPHLLRHNFAQVALEKGAERLAVMDMLGHKSEAMSRRYAGNVRQMTAARQMPKYSPL